jgi:WD40 repeat protein/tRNA A-37 threonylcarbamoyl transferase component Bud32
VNTCPDDVTLDQLLEARLASSSALPDYEILGELGRGGMGVVFKARDRKLNRVVAIKTILSGTRAGAEERERFQTEARALAAVRHPNIVQIHEVGEHHDLAYLVLEYLPGGSLAQRLARAPMEPHAAAELVEVLARSMYAVHKAGIVHRDLKPGNILFAEDDTPRITDFGVAKPMGESSSGPAAPTRIGQFMGTPSYMAPEQLQGDPAAVGPPADIYALGSILYESLTAQPPFRAVASVVMFYQVMYQEPPRPGQLVPHVPADLETIALKCLSKEPEKRYANAEELADDLRRFLRNEPIRARPISRGERIWKWARRRPAVAGLLAAVVLVTVLGICGIVWQWLAAVAAREHALDASMVANQQRDRAESERATARWQFYRASISAASSSLLLGNTLACRQALASAPEEHRDWEWSYFQGRLQNALALMEGHQARVTGAAFSRDGTRLASWSDDGTVQLWDCTTQRAIATMGDEYKEVNGAVFTPDGSFVASVWGTRISTWDGRTGKAIKSWTGQQGTCAPVVTPDGARLLTGDEKGLSAHVWDLASGRSVAELKHPVSPGEVAVSPDGAWIAVAGGETVQFWDGRSHKQRSKIYVKGGGVQSIAFSPDSSQLATGWNFPDNKVRVYDVATGKLVYEGPGHQNRVTVVKFSPDGSRVASASMDQTVRLWDVVNKRPVGVLRGHTSHVNHLAFNANGSRLVSASFDSTLRLWDTDLGEPLAVLLGHSDKVNTAVFRPNGKLIASTSNDKTVGLWDVTRLEHGGVLKGHKSYVYDVSVSPDGKRIASAAWDGEVRIWDMTGHVLRTLAADHQLMHAVAFSPDGRRLAAGSRDRRVWLWDLEADRPPLQVRMPGTGVDSVSFSPDGKRLAVALGHVVARFAGDPTVRLLDTASGEEVAVLRGHTDNVVAVRFSADGRRIASGNFDGTVRIWDGESGKPIATLHGHADCVRAVAWSANTSMLASASDDRTVRLWDAKTLAPIGVLSHSNTVYAVAFSPKGTRLAAGCEDNTIRLWDMNALQEVAELVGHTAYVHAVVFSPDGKRLISASGDHTLRIWDTAPSTK